MARYLDGAAMAVVQVAAGDGYSACVAEDGSAYTWGDNGKHWTSIQLHT